MGILANQFIVRPYQFIILSPTKTIFPKGGLQLLIDLHLGLLSEKIKFILE
ncbi:hypothetical protein METHB2_530004 [Candidatus Methylobacter favarea]|uniref:Uncharacterized protein n=1 Tax=Candidatus Methylobacter favarea TaxID=2707345 RepID=A0A8S0Y6Q7_9GAMM|nr:hypothetical protein METHB2_530004 [Candidatus Methylobacter favarea]